MLRKLGTAVRTHLKSTILISAVLVFAGTGVGLSIYAVHQWHVAQLAVKENRLDEAAKSLRVCLFVWPRSVPVHILAARAARSRGNFDEAETHLSRCLKLEHKATEAIEVEFLLMRVQKGEEDVVAPELMLYVEDRYVEAPLILETLARAYMYHLRYGPAYHYLSRWLELEPNSAQAHVWRGWVVERLNDWDGALSDYQRALELDPQLTDVHIRIAEMSLDKSNVPEALKHLEPLHKQFPDRAVVNARLGQCCFLRGDFDEARALLEAAFQELPDDSSLVLCLARLEMQVGNLSKAERLLRHVLKVDPMDTEVQFTLAGCLQLQERWKDAEVTLDQHRKDTVQLRKLVQMIQDEAQHPSSDPAPAAEIGAAFLHSNERVGLYWLHKALQRDPRYQATLKTLAEHYESKGDKERAAQYRRRLNTESNPEKRAATP